MKYWLLLMIVFLFAESCKTGNKLLGKRTLHEKYADKLKEAGLDNTAMGRLWLSEAAEALLRPQAISLPYKQLGYFAADKPAATGLIFNAIKGQKLLFKLERKPVQNFALYADLWKPRAGEKPALVRSVDTSSIEFEVEIEETGNYLLRLQPELLKNGEYTLSIAVGPSLGFPAASGRVGSVWGDSRDAGGRSHEGIDIFASRGTPVTAAADGIITRVGNNELGGKIIFMRPSGKNISLYYAHLDSQLVASGQKVKLGDTIGLMGNTGNARSTPPHLHFGIYGISGAIDPLPFVNQAIKRPDNVPVGTEKLNRFLRVSSTNQNKESSLKVNDVFYAMAAGPKEFLGETPLGEKIKIPITSTQHIDKQIVTKLTRDTSYLLSLPQLHSPRKMRLAGNTPISVHGYYNEYAYVRSEKNEGWILKTNLK